MLLADILTQLLFGRKYKLDHKVQFFHKGLNVRVNFRNHLKL